MYLISLISNGPQTPNWKMSWCNFNRYHTIIPFSASLFEATDGDNYKLVFNMPKCCYHSQHLEKLQDFWSTLDDIDRSHWAAVPEHLHSSISCRQINIGLFFYPNILSLGCKFSVLFVSHFPFLGDDCCIMLSLNVKDPGALPE